MASRVGAGRPHFKRKALRSIGVACAALWLTGCVVRTQEFHCTASLVEGPVSEQDLEMSPTELRFNDLAYPFREEVGVERVYQRSSGETVRFNVATNELRLGGQTWSCRRYLTS